MQGAPVYDYPSSILTLNITVISDPSSLKFSDGIARKTYQNALNPNQFAKVRVPVLTQVKVSALVERPACMCTT